MFQHSLENRCPAGQALVIVLRCRGRRPIKRRLQALVRAGGPGPGCSGTGHAFQPSPLQGPHQQMLPAGGPGERPQAHSPALPRWVTPLLLKALLLTEESDPDILTAAHQRLTPAGPILSLETGVRRPVDVA